jgi:hypothetical protein
MVAGLVAVTAVASRAATGELISADADLIDLGHQFEEVVGIIDRAIDAKSDLTFDILERLEIIERAILTKKAMTINGLRVKARAACWARLGDLDETDQSSMDLRMAMSIIRDLIRVHDAELENPGALTQLMAEFD